MKTSPPSSPAPSSSAAFLGSSTRGRYLRLLTNAQLGSGLVFSSFLLVHLIPPALAALTGEERAASAFMLLGRVYYQSPLGEPIVVYGSLVVHLLSSTVKRLLSPSPLSLVARSSHALAGWALVLPLTYHVLTHRLGPASPRSPINALSPAELDYSFVAGAIDLYPLGSRLAYGALGGLALWHALGGLAIVRHRWGAEGLQILDRLLGRPDRASLKSGTAATNPMSRLSSRRRLLNSRTIGTVVGCAILALGLYRLEHDAFIPAHLRRRIAESHRIYLPWLFK